MSDVSCFWRDSEFQDATLLLSSDTLSLEQTRQEIEETFSGTNDDCDCVWSCLHNPKKRKLNPTVETGVSASHLVLPAEPVPSIAASPPKISSPESAPVGHPKVLTIPVHRIVLSTGSAYFKTAISTLIGERASAAAAAADKRSGSERRILRPFHPIIVVHEEEVDAAESVLQFLYTKTVDSKFSTASQLMQVLLIADRWVVLGCVTACCKALTALPAESLSLDDVLAIYSPGQGPLPPSLLNATDFKPVLELALSKLLQLFGNVPAVVASTTLTAQLLQLPYAAILALLSSDALTTDSEDSVLMLLSWWLERRQAAPGDDEAGVREEEGLQDLMGAIRYSQLSSTYLSQAWALVKRLKPSEDQMAELHHFRSLSPQHAGLHIEEACVSCPPGWLKARRPILPGGDSSTVTLTLNISAAQLTEHLASVRAMKEGGSKPAPLTSAVDFRGLNIFLKFTSPTCGDEVQGKRQFVGAFVGVGVRLPNHGSDATLKFGIPSCYKISIQRSLPIIQVHTADSISCLARNGLGWWNFAQHTSKLPGDPLLLSWWDPFMVDGHVRLTAEFTDQRTI